MKTDIEYNVIFESVNAGIKFDNEKYHQNCTHNCNEDKVRDLILLLFKAVQYYQNLKHDCSEDKVEDLILLLSKIIIIIIFSFLMLEASKVKVASSM